MALDNQLFSALIAIINAGLPAWSITATVKQSMQPTTQGVPPGPTVFIFKIGDRRYGSKKVVDAWNEDLQQQEQTETQQYETTFQISALAIQDPSNVDSLTASDIVNSVAAIMNSDSTIQTLEADGMGIYRITDVRNPYFQDDKGNNEASPSFDFTITHKQVSVTVIPTADPVSIQIYPV